MLHLWTKYLNVWLYITSKGCAVHELSHVSVMSLNTGLKASKWWCWEHWVFVVRCALWQAVFDTLDTTHQLDDTLVFISWCLLTPLPPPGEIRSTKLNLIEHSCLRFVVAAVCDNVYCIFVATAQLQEQVHGQSTRWQWVGILCDQQYHHHLLIHSFVVLSHLAPFFKMEKVACQIKN